MPGWPTAARALAAVPFSQLDMVWRVAKVLSALALDVERMQQRLRLRQALVQASTLHGVPPKNTKLLVVGR